MTLRTDGPLAPLAPVDRVRQRVAPSGRVVHAQPHVDDRRTVDGEPDEDLLARRVGRHPDKLPKGPVDACQNRLDLTRDLRATRAVEHGYPVASDHDGLSGRISDAESFLPGTAGVANQRHSL